MSNGPRKPDAGSAREARMKAALRANLARRKAQTRARSAQEAIPEDEQHGQNTPPDGRAPENEE